MNIELFAKKTFLALKNTYHSVIRVRPLIIDQAASLLGEGKEVYYVGVKNTSVIPYSLIKDLEAKGFLWHTVDAMSHGGRAVDINLINPITSNVMTGSSSGTAINVLYGINDIGIGTDGGGSVLAPAASLNLFGFISPLLRVKEKDTIVKISTDGIQFRPSIGFITRDFNSLYRVISESIGMREDNSIKEMDVPTLVIPSNKRTMNNHFEVVSYIQSKIGGLQKSSIEKMEYPDIYKDRKTLLSFLTQDSMKNKIIVSLEGPVDLYGMGDSVFGQFDKQTSMQQSMSYKGLLRVVNMASKSGIIIPMKELGVGLLLICDSCEEQILYMLFLASKLAVSRPNLMESYMMNLDLHFGSEFMEDLV